MFTKPSTNQCITTMPFAWKLFGIVCLLAIPVEVLWLWEPNSGYVSKLMVLAIAVISLIGGVELLSFRLVLDEKQISIRRWPRLGLTKSYSDISDIRVRGELSTVVIFKTNSSTVDRQIGDGVIRIKIPASAIKPARLSELLNRKISGVRK
jgi:hypothetical protein